MILAILCLLSGLSISSVAIFFSVTGLIAIFNSQPLLIGIMGVTLEIAKLITASWLERYWSVAPRKLKWYMISATVVLMLITTMGIFGFLSKAHSEFSVLSQQNQSQIANLDAQLNTLRERLKSNQTQIAQMDSEVDQLVNRTSDAAGITKANRIRNSQKSERAAVLADQKEINQNIIDLENQKLKLVNLGEGQSAELAPIKYVAELIYSDSSQVGVDRAVRLVILLLVITFDPLAISLLLAGQWTLHWNKSTKTTVIINNKESTIDPVSTISETPSDSKSIHDISKNDNIVTGNQEINSSEYIKNSQSYIDDLKITAKPLSIINLNPESKIYTSTYQQNEEQHEPSSLWSKITDTDSLSNRQLLELAERVLNDELDVDSVEEPRRTNLKILLETGEFPKNSKMN